MAFARTAESRKLDELPDNFPKPDVRSFGRLRDRFFVLLRFYGSEKPVFDKAWQLLDIEQVK